MPVIQEEARHLCLETLAPFMELRMAILDSTLTDTEFGVLLDALDQWEQVGRCASKESCREAVTIIKAKLSLQRQSARIDQKFDETTASHTG